MLIMLIHFHGFLFDENKKRPQKKKKTCRIFLILDFDNPRDDQIYTLDAYLYITRNVFPWSSARSNDCFLPMGVYHDKYIWYHLLCECFVEYFFE